MPSQQAPRVLIQVPILHSEADMGTLGPRLPRHRARGLAQARWAEIRERVQGLGLDWPKVKGYQDGLPDADPDLIRRIVAGVESPNYELLRWLIAQGAELVGTESPALLWEEYGHLQAVLMAKSPAARTRARRAYAERAAALLAERDAYIARRIAATLLPGEIGVLFIGAAHRVAERLPADIAVQVI